MSARNYRHLPAVKISPQRARELITLLDKGASEGEIFLKLTLDESEWLFEIVLDNEDWSLRGILELLAHTR